jgi:hypothetical protein
MTKKVLTIDTLAGIQRDGTVFDLNFYTDGQWVRFQRGRPRKMGGYRSITQAATGLSRGMYVNSADGVNQVFSGYSSGLEVINIDNLGIGGGINQFTFNGYILTLNTLVGGSTYTNGTYTNVSLTGGSGTGAKATIVVSGATVTSVTLTAAGNGYAIGNTLSATAASIGGTGTGFSIKVATINNEFVASDLNLWQFDSLFDSQGSGNQLLLAHPGRNLAQIDQTVSTAVLAGNINGTTLQPLRDTNGTSPTGETISVSGGVCVLHPYVFVYGDNGLIKNSVAGDPYDWNGPDSNETNVASTKIVKGLPVRGGSNAPSGLFWALDSLIRVSYTPTTITVGGTAQTFYWRYDIITSQSSIMSSQCVIEYDGIYYWVGVDRFLLYNGVVKEIANTFNQNYFFDNLNYAQNQKVWAQKVPRFGEIWWFFPSGDSEECNDAIIYNIRENCWYDAGGADGARRSAGYFSQVFHYPIAAGTAESEQVLIFSASIITNSSTTIQVPVTNQIAVGQVVIASNIPDNTTVTVIVPSATAGYFDVTISAAATTSATVIATFNTKAGQIILWQHEIGTDEVIDTTSNAIASSFQTSDLGWVAGGPAQASPVGDNFWLRIERIEPDFIQSGTMSVQVIGRPFAQGADVTSDPFYFEPTTGKVDMREQRREIRLIFTSNIQGGNYQLGKVLLNATIGDTRPYGS